MKGRKKIIAGIVIAVVALIVMVNIGSSGGKSLAVTVEKVQKRNLAEKVSASGEIKPKKNINISTDVAGKILKILVREGDLVGKGQLLIKIDSAIYEANADRDREIISASQADLISQEANLKKALHYLNRRRQLFDEGLISREQFEDAGIQHEIAQANQKVQPAPHRAGPGLPEKHQRRHPQDLHRLADRRHRHQPESRRRGSGHHRHHEQSRNRAHDHRRPFGHGSGSAG